MMCSTYLRLRRHSKSQICEDNEKGSPLRLPFLLLATLSNEILALFFFVVCITKDELARIDTLVGLNFT